MEKRPPLNLHPDLLPHVKLFPHIVPIIPQEQKKWTWCGAACMSMMLTHAIGGNHPDYTQEKIWWRIGQRDRIEAERQVSLARHYYFRSHWGQVNEPENPKKLRSFFKRLVNEYKIPVEILYPFDETGDTGHFVLVVGANEKKVLVVDPYPQRGVGTLAYEELAPYFSYQDNGFFPGIFVLAYNQDMTPWMPEATRY